MSKFNLFISYSHKDVKFLDEIREFINVNNLPDLNIWDDGKIELGESWDNTIKNNLITADIVLLLVSQSFLISAYVNNVELKTALERNKQGKCTVIPVFVRDCDLDNFQDITSLQGIPSTKKFLIGISDERDKYYLELEKKIKSIITKLKSIYTPLPDPPSKNDIYLSILGSKDGLKRRNGLIYQVEGKLRHNEWQFGKIVPDIQMAEEILQKPESEQIEIFKSLMADCAYAIHIFDKESLNSYLNQIQYRVAKDGEKISLPFKNIIWMLNSEAEDNLDDELHTNPCVKDTDYEKVFDLINDIDIQRQQLIRQKVNVDSTKKKVYMIYDFNKDHNNPTRIKLKDKLEKDQNISVIGRNVSEDKLSEEKQIIQTCQGAVIFYGDSDCQWFLKRQDNIILDANLKAVCIDEPFFETKIKRDVWKNEIDLIRGREDSEFEIDSDIFINKLKGIRK